MRVYIAGSMTGVFDYKEPFMRAEKALKELGHIVVNPAYLPEGLNDYFEINKAMIDQCDAIYVLIGSEGSVGTQKEVKYCKRKGWIEGKQIIYQKGSNGCYWSWTGGSPISHGDIHYRGYPWGRNGIW